jgi:hypothetical protein
MAIANLAPNERYALIGKTRSGKTQQAIVLASLFAQQLHSPWEVWWIDTKNDPKDIKKLRTWGFCNGANPEDMKRVGGLRNALYFIIKDQGPYSAQTLAQAKIAEAYERGHILLVIDEYTQVVQSDRNAGNALDNVFARGGGKNVGLIGLTQEPVYVPRKLLSQASHLALFTVTYKRDIDYLKNFCKGYVPPAEQGDPYGFYWSHIDGSAQWAYYQNQAAWAEGLNFALPKEPTPSR